MSYQLLYSPSALRDLDRIWAEVYSASQERGIAGAYVDGLMKAVAQKCNFPLSGTPLYYDGRFTGYYFVVFKAYIAFYRVQDESVFVDRVLFGKSDYMRKLF